MPISSLTFKHSIKALFFNVIIILFITSLSSCMNSGGEEGEGDDEESDSIASEKKKKVSSNDNNNDNANNDNLVMYKIDAMEGFFEVESIARLPEENFLKRRLAIHIIDNNSFFGSFVEVIYSDNKPESIKIRQKTSSSIQPDYFAAKEE